MKFKKNYLLLLVLLSLFFCNVYALDVTDEASLVSCLQSTSSVNCVLTNDITLTTVTTVNSKITLDVNGNKLILNKDYPSLGLIKIAANNGDLTILGTGNSVLEVNINTGDALNNLNKLTLNIAKVDINIQSGSFVKNHGIIVVDNGTYNMNKQTYFIDSATDGGDVTINNGNFNVKKGSFVGNYGTNNLIINNGTFINYLDGSVVFLCSMGTTFLTINNGTFKDDSSVNTSTWFNVNKLVINDGSFNVAGSLINSSVSATILGGSINAGLLTVQSPTLTVGTNDNEIKNSPTIIIDGIITSSAVNTIDFYDGTITGNQNPPYSNTITLNTIEDKYNVKDNANGTYTMRLTNEIVEDNNVDSDTTTNTVVSNSESSVSSDKSNPKTGVFISAIGLGILILSYLIFKRNKKNNFFKI